FFIEIVRFLPVIEALFVRIELPVARRIRRVDLVDQHDIAAVAVQDAELVLRIDENKPSLSRYLRSAGIERERRGFDRIYGFAREYAFVDDLLRRERTVVLVGFRRGSKDRPKELLVLFHAVRQFEIAE